MFYDFIHLHSNFPRFRCIDSPSLLKRSRANENSYYLIDFNGNSAGKFIFQEHQITELSVKINAYVNGTYRLGYIDIDHTDLEWIGLLSKIKLLPLDKKAQSINDYILSLACPDPFELEIKLSFMHLNIINTIDQKLVMSFEPEDISQFDRIFDYLFLGDTINDKIKNYAQKRSIFTNESKTLNILDKVFKNGLEIKFFNKKIIEKDIYSDDTIDVGLLNFVSQILDKIKVINNLGIENKIDQEIINSSTDENLIRLGDVFDRVFLGETIELKIENYNQKRLIFENNPEYLGILNKVFKLGLFIKIFKEKLFIDQIPSDFRFNELIIANKAKTNLVEAILSASSLNGCESFIQILLAEDRSIAFKDLIGTIKNSVIKNNESLAYFLLSKLKKTNFKDLIKEIKNAVEENNESLVRLFLSEDRQIPSKDLGEILTIASEKNYPSILEFILTKDISCCVGYLSESIKIAAKNGSKKIIDLFLSKKELIPKSYIGEAFVIAAQEHHQDIIKLLLAQEIDISIEYLEEAFLIAAQEGYKNLIELLLLQKLDISSKCFMNSVVKALEYEHIDIIELILKNKDIKSCRLIGAVIESFKYNKDFVFWFVFPEDGIIDELRLKEIINYSEIVKFLLLETGHAFEERLKLIIKLSVECEYNDLFENVFIKYRTIYPKYFEDVLVIAVNENNLIILDIILNNIVVSDECLEIALISAIKKNNRKLVSCILSEDSLVSFEVLSKALLISIEYKNSESLVNNIFQFFISKRSDIPLEELECLLISLASIGYESIVFFILSNYSIPYHTLIKAAISADEKKQDKIVEIILSNLEFNFEQPIPLSIKSDYLKLQDVTIDPESSWERLINKLTIFADGNAEYIEIINKAFLNLNNHSPFLGTPPISESLDSWYLHIKELLRQIDSRIDFSKEKDVFEKTTIIKDIFGYCGGAWQADLEQMQESLIQFPDTVSIEVIICEKINKLANSVSELINENYASIMRINPDVHHQNKIKSYLKDFFVKKVLNDHLANILWTEKLVKLKFVKKFNLKSFIEIILYEIEHKEIFKEKINNYYRTTLFKDTPPNKDICEKIDGCIAELENLDKIQSFFRGLQSIIKDFNIDDQIKIINILNCSVNQVMFKVNVKRNIEIRDSIFLLTDKQINDLFGQKEIVKTMFEFLLKIKDKNYFFSFKDILTQTKDQLISVFMEKKQQMVELYFVEKFETEHIDEKGILLPSGIEIILNKMGFSLPLI